VQVPPKGIQKNKFENLVNLAETNAGQETLVLKTPAPVMAKAEQPVVADQATLGVVTPAGEPADAMGQALAEMDGDAPACPTCGHITVRNGACYKCLNCGDSLGCS
jgi:hypothetical protein